MVYSSFDSHVVVLLEDTPSITVSNDRPQSPPPAASTETTTTTSTTDNTSAPITNTTPIASTSTTDITPTHTTTENIQKEEAATAQTPLPDVKKHDNAVTLVGNDDDEARFYEPMPEDASTQKPLLRSLYVSMTKKFNIPSPT